MLMNGSVFRNHEGARSVLVQSVNDSGPEPGSHALECRAVIKEPVDQGAGTMPGSRMDHPSGGLVHHDDVGVFIKNMERYRLRIKADGFRRRNVSGHPFTGSYTVPGFFWRTVHTDVSGTDVVSHQRAGIVGYAGSDKCIKAFPRVGQIDTNGKRFGFWHTVLKRFIRQQQKTIRFLK